MTSFRPTVMWTFVHNFSTEIPAAASFQPSDDIGNARGTVYGLTPQFILLLLSFV